jgi:hypothetical protein
MPSPLPCDRHLTGDKKVLYQDLDAQVPGLVHILNSRKPEMGTFVMGRFAPDTMVMSKLASRHSSRFRNPCRLCAMYRLRKPGYVCNMHIVPQPHVYAICILCPVAADRPLYDSGGHMVMPSWSHKRQRLRRRARCRVELDLDSPRCIPDSNGGCSRLGLWQP